MGDESHWILSLGPIQIEGTVLMMTVLTVVIVFSLVYWASRNMKLKPKGKQNVLEWVVDFVAGIVKNNQSAKELKHFHLISFVIFTFLLTANNLGLVTKLVVSSHKGEVSFWKSPTADPVVTLTLALLVVLLSNFMGVKRLGFKGYFQNTFMQPVKFLLPMKVLEEFTNLLTLGLRLYGNIYAGEVLLGLLCNMVASNGYKSFVFLPVAVPLEVLWTGFSVFISCIQAFIFTTLFNVYVGHKLVSEH